MTALCADIRAEVVREYSFQPLGDIPDFLPQQIAFDDTGGITLYGVTDETNSFLGIGRAIARWNESDGLSTLHPRGIGTISVTDVSYNGSVVIGTRDRSISGLEGFRWTESGGYEQFQPNPDTGGTSSAIGTNPAGELFTGERPTMGPAIFNNELQNTSILLHPAAPGRPVIGSDILRDPLGNVWVSGGYGYVWRNGEVMFEPDLGSLSNGANGIANIEGGVRAITATGTFVPVAGPISSPGYVDFPIDEPESLTFNSLPFIPTHITTDGSVILGNLFNEDPFRRLELMIWEEGNKPWGTSESNPFLQDILTDNLPADEQALTRITDWTLSSSFNRRAPQRDVANFRDGTRTISAIIAQGINPDGQVESYLATVTATTVPDPSEATLSLEVSYDNGMVVEGGLLDGLEALPETLQASFTLAGDVAGTEFGLANVLDFELTVAKQQFSLIDLDSFSLIKEPGLGGDILSLIYSATNASGLTASNFPLTLSGRTGDDERFEYLYSDSQLNFTVVPEPQSAVLLLFATLSALLRLKQPVF